MGAAVGAAPMFNQQQQHRKKSQMKNTSGKKQTMKPIEMKEHLLYEVRMIVAVPNYGAGTSSPLDLLALQNLEQDDMIVLDMSELELCLMHQVHGFGDIATEIVIAQEKQAAAVITPAVDWGKRAARTTVQAPHSYDKWSKQETKAMWQLKKQGLRTKQIAKALGRSEKSIANHIYVSRKAGQ
ncbi:hypothetical protein UFOVP625_6 [uncultured Caudovirales phage]|uniref:Uncharacterized protein n=1 Tax=uncultured Caudovirales phage TaxID=2100421 RepID=A0A6J5N472_9CAUD|nr:hypothetical protein UFOVP625_6 [uncultured Caudovirales phage]